MMSPSSYQLVEPYSLDLISPSQQWKVQRVSSESTTTTVRQEHGRYLSRRTASKLALAYVRLLSMRLVLALILLPSLEDILISSSDQISLQLPALMLLLHLVFKERTRLLLPQDFPLSLRFRRKIHTATCNTIPRITPGMCSQSRLPRHKRKL